jgi:hypothetical protein
LVDPLLYFGRGKTRLNEKRGSPERISPYLIYVRAQSSVKRRISVTPAVLAGIAHRLFLRHATFFGRLGEGHILAEDA